MHKEICIVRNRITLQAAILDCSEAAVHSHSFSKIYPGNTGCRVLLLVQLQIGCSEWGLYTKMTPPRIFFSKSYDWTVQNQPSTVIHFPKFVQEIPVVESSFWSNYRLTVKSGILF